MRDGRTEHALSRIESALARIERIVETAPETSGDNAALAELTARHESLRREAQRAVKELDALIGEHG